MTRPAIHAEPPLTCDNGSEAAPGGNPIRPLTHSLDCTEEGLAMKATRKRRRTYLEMLDRAAERSIVDQNGCWVFQGALSQGYGTIGRHRETWRVHRLAYHVMVCELPADLVLDHLCRNRACWNPEHLDPVPLGVNLHRGEGRTFVAYRNGVCIRGHDQSVPGNVYVSGGKKRQCAVCVRANAKRRYQQRRAA